MNTGEFDDELSVAGTFMVAFLAGFVFVAVTGAAVAWNVASYAAEAVRALRS